MAIEKRQGKSSTVWRVYWINPVTKKREAESFRSKEDAQIYDAQVKKRIKDDPTSFAPGALPSSGLTFAMLAERWLVEHPPAASNLRSTFSALAARVMPFLGGIEARLVGPEDMKPMVRAWLKDGLADTSVKRHVGMVKGIVSWAKREGYLSENLLRDYTFQGKPSQRIPPPTKEEVDALYQHASPNLRRMIILAVSVGARVGPSELFSVKWSDVYLDEDCPFVRIWSAKKNKNEFYRDIPLADQVVSMLRTWRVEDGPGVEYVISYRGGRVRTFRTSWETAKKKAGITRRLRPYDLRHYFATQSLGHGADLKTVSMLMGHADVTMTLKVYQHVLQPNKKAAVAAIPLPSLGTFLGHTSPETPQNYVPNENKVQ